MKEEFQREVLIFCIGLIREGFLQVGYKDDKDRIHAVAKGLLKSWKRKWARWDKYDLEKQCQTYLEKGIGKLTVPEIVSHLSSVYKISHPSSQVQPDIDRPQVEKNYLKEIICRIEEEDYFSENTHWLEFSLFHIPMELCREFIPQEYFEEFERLKDDLKTSGGVPTNTILKRILKGPQKGINQSLKERELVKKANEVLQILINRKSRLFTLLF